MLKRSWNAFLRGWIVLGRALGVINTYILLTLVFVLMLPWIRLWWLITRKDPLDCKLAREDAAGSSWKKPDHDGSPGIEYLERYF